ncbi:helix-turn-helix transcriptional regulator [Streptomyces sp. NPDC058108]|uniref:helix-turn-helix transcriptional regulator n=1 Tax=Streptomyces sp. NPDC058108 TaxID=3346344 RepID=UPI0036E4818E
MTVRVAGRVYRVLTAIHTLDRAWGLSICQASGLGSGTVYPILERLREAGWIGYRIEENPAPGHPPRTFYHLTLRGQIGAGLEPDKEQQ